jgi:hypothetical protein
MYARCHANMGSSERVATRVAVLCVSGEAPSVKSALWLLVLVLMVLVLVLVLVLVVLVLA